MPEPLKPRSAEVNGKLWGGAAADWSAIQEGQFAPAYHAVFDRLGLGDGMRHLDAGCGAGMAAGIARDRGARVAGIDASKALLELARRRVPDGRFHHADLEELPFEDDSFDAVTGFNAFQFAANVAEALAEARRVCRPGGQVVVLTWGDPEGMEAASLVAALRPLLPPPPPGAPGPFTLSDPALLREAAVAGGLRPLDIVDGELDWTYPDLATALRGLGSSGVAVRAAALAGRPALDAAHAGALAPFVRPDGSYRIGVRYRYLVAEA